MEDQQRPGVVEDKLLDPTTAPKRLAIVGGVIVAKMAVEAEVFFKSILCSVQRQREKGK